MIQVHLEHAWHRLGWNAYIYQHHAPGDSTLWLYDAENAEWRQEALPRDIDFSTKPTLFLRDEMLRALVDAAIEKLPADGAMAAHLTDAQSTRDRLLTLIEARGLR